MADDDVLRKVRPPVDLRIDYEAELNPQQCEAAMAPAGPSLVLAGAGSGKTRTLTYRVAYLIEQGVPPDRILLLTFTNKAAREMMGRVADLVGTELSDLWGGTFHSVGVRILRANAAAIGFRSDFSILDREDSEAMLRICLVDAGGGKPDPTLPKAEVLSDLFSWAANERRSIAETIDKYHPKLADVTDRLAGLASRYAERKRANNAMDFDDLLALWLRLFEENAGICERYQDRFEWLLVDEYQDTNQIQGDLIDLLAVRHRNVMAVGDDAQSIYAWRGANFRNILEFPKRYPGARVFRVETNYRSTPEIVAVANAAIACNTAQFQKELTSARRSGVKPVVVACEDGRQQAAFVAQRIWHLQEEGVPLSQMAILYRSHFHALELQLELTRRRIPFVITSGIRFFEQAHIKDVAAWLKLLVNPSDELAFQRMALLLPGVGSKSAEKLGVAFRAAHGSPESSQPGMSTPIASALMAVRAAVPKKAVLAWASLATTVSQLEQPSGAGLPGEMIQTIVEGFYEDYAHDTFGNAPSRLDDLSQLAAFAGQFDSVAEFLTQFSLLTQIEVDAEQRLDRKDDRVRLSTVHQAKGLEFQVVMVIMLGEGLFPSARSLDNLEAIEEERRLFYVAVTRARDELYLCHPAYRTMAGQGISYLMRSRFLGEIPVGSLEMVNLRPVSTWGLDATEKPDSEIQEDPF